MIGLIDVTQNQLISRNAGNRRLTTVRSGLAAAQLLETLSAEKLQLRRAEPSNLREIMSHFRARPNDSNPEPEGTDIQAPRGARDKALRIAAFASQRKFTAGSLVYVTDLSASRLLLVQGRFKSRSAWSLPAGFINRCESFEAAARRETFEETDLRLSRIEFCCAHKQPWADHVDFLFTASTEPSINISRANLEIQRSAWFDIENLPILTAAAQLAKQVIDRGAA